MGQPIDSGARGASTAEGAGVGVRISDEELRQIDCMAEDGKGQLPRVVLDLTEEIRRHRDEIAALERAFADVARDRDAQKAGRESALSVVAAQVATLDELRRRLDTVIANAASSERD